MAPHSSILAWRIPRTEEPGRLQSTGSQRVGHDWATNIFIFISRSLEHDNNAVWNFTQKKNFNNKWKMSILKYPEVYSVFQKDVSHLPFGTPERISKYSTSKISVSTPDTTEVSDIPYRTSQQGSNIWPGYKNMCLRKLCWKGPCKGWVCSIYAGFGPTGEAQNSQSTPPELRDKSLAHLSLQLLPTSLTSCPALL